MVPAILGRPTFDGNQILLNPYPVYPVAVPVGRQATNASKFHELIS